MLIIFDLDDTLIDTFNCISPYKLKNALFKMVGAGLKVDDVSQAFSEIERLNISSQSTEEALGAFLTKKQGQKFLDVGLQELNCLLPKSFRVKQVDDAKSILKKLKSHHRLALVTRGNREQQLDKLAKSGIDYALFCHVIVCDGDKEPAYKKVVDHQGFAPSEVIVCGDRPELDLVPAKNLGYNTVHFKNGRGQSTDSSFVDFQIDKLQDLLDVVAALETKLVKR